MGTGEGEKGLVGRRVQSMEALAQSSALAKGMETADERSESSKWREATRFLSFQPGLCG